jgi:hypothetical protein
MAIALAVRHMAGHETVEGTARMGGTNTALGGEAGGTCELARWMKRGMGDCVSAGRLTGHLHVQ